MNPHFRTALPLAGIFYENNRHLQDMFSAGLIDKDSCLNIVKPDLGMDELYAGVYGDADHMFVNANSSSVSVSPKKRKADKSETLIKVVSEKQKKIKGCSKGDVKITRKNNDNSKQASPNASTKEKSEVSEVQKLDYIHVRARRGQATDSHSLAERVRREKISERMKYLQDLVPGCNKITGKAGMLDEIINYVQSLQKQVEFLSMKLATANPELDFNIDDLFTTEFPALGCSLANSAYVDQSNPLDQVVLYRGLDMGINSAEMGLKRSLSTPISIPETFMDSSCYNVVSSDISTLFFQL